jgi:hypothetical protein
MDNNPKLRREEAIKQRESARRSNELALEKASANRETTLAGLKHCLMKSQLKQYNTVQKS